MTELSRRVLDAHQTIVLATVSPGGEPEAASVVSAPDYQGGRLSLVCALAATSTKLAHRRGAPRTGIYVGPHAPTIWLQGSADATIFDGVSERVRR